MEISFIEPHLKIYGGIRRIIELSNRLTVRGHHVTIYHSDGSPCSWMRCDAEVRPYKEVLDKVHDVIIFNDPNPIDYKLVRDARSKLKIFYVLELYNKRLLKGFNPEIYLPWNQRMLILEKCLVSNYLKLVNATWEKEWLKENMKINSMLLLGGINMEMFHPVKVIKDPCKVYILYSGDPRKRKGKETILEAIEIVKKEEPKVELETYYGSGIPQDKMSEKYCKADIFVDGSWSAGWNNPVAEAMSCRVPVVCTDIGGVKDFAFNRKTALLVPVRNPHAMANAIIELIRNNKLREKLVKNAYQHIMQFDWDNTTERLEEIIYYKLNEKRKEGRYRFPTRASNVISSPKKVVIKLKGLLVRKFKRRQSFDKYLKFGAYHWKSFEEDKVYRKHVNYILKEFGKRDRGTLLDIGCGDGLISCLLAKEGFRVKGIDIEREAIKLAKEKCKSADFEVANVFNIAGDYEYLVSSEVIEHLLNPDEFLEKISGIFKKEALITTPKKDYYKETDPYHFKEYSILEFENLIEKYFNNFKVYSSKHHLYAWIINKNG